MGDRQDRQCKNIIFNTKATTLSVLPLLQVKAVVRRDRLQYHNSITMCQIVILIAAIVAGNAVVSFAKLEEVFGWKDVSYQWPSKDVENNAIASGEYIAKNNLPLGLIRWKDKMFITVPR